MKRDGSGGPHPENWDAWCRHLANRRRPRTPQQLGASFKWWIPTEAAETKRLVKALERIPKQPLSTERLARELEAWLEQAEGRTPDDRFSLECLAWCYALPPIAASLPAAPWCQLLDFLRDVAQDAAGLSLDEEAAARLLLAGELAWTLWYLFPELPECSELGRVGRKALSHGVQELLDGEGMPHSSHIPKVPALLASFTRCQLLAESVGKPCFNKDAKNQYEWFVRQALRLARYDGRQVLSDPHDVALSSDAWQAALDLSDDDDDFAISRIILDDDLERKSDAYGLPEPTVYSEWSQAAVLRSCWSGDSEQLAIVFGDQDIRTELNCRRTTVWSGSWQPELLIDKRRLEMVEDWSEVCWLSDDDVDYLELEGEFESGWRVQRQFLLARRDRFLLVADAVLGRRKANINLHSTCPIVPQSDWQQEEETREGFLCQGGRRLAMVMPLSLPEWRSGSSPGSLVSQTDGLRISQVADAQRLYVPLFFDLHPKRLRKKRRTWRQLTVAQRLEIQPPEVATGFRIQVGKEQWMFYRSLANPANRTLLGQNLSTEFLFGRFEADGEVTEYIEIE